MRIMVVGARQGSLGEAIVSSGMPSAGEEVVSAGISGEEVELNLIWNERNILSVLEEIQPHDIIVTAGVNRPTSWDDDDFLDGIFEETLVNYLGVMRLLRCWLMADFTDKTNFVAISSNSAHIARSPSAGYCASKAALSMGIRCIARDVAKRFDGYPAIWGVEPGFIGDTPMSKGSEEKFGDHAHRIPGGDPMSKFSVADIIMEIITSGLSKSFHGTMLRLDRGEQ